MTNMKKKPITRSKQQAKSKTHLDKKPFYWIFYEANLAFPPEVSKVSHAMRLICVIELPNC